MVSKQGIEVMLKYFKYNVVGLDEWKVEYLSTDKDGLGKED